MKQYSMIINGQSVSSGNVADVINPATEQPFARVHIGDAELVNQAVSAARSAFPLWSQTPISERDQMLLELASAMQANMPELMELVTLESGKPMGGLNGIGSGMEVGGSIAWTQYTTSLELPTEVVQDNEEALVEVHRKALGVVASITPWNWPLMIAIWHIAPALKAGNTVVIKPSSLTPTATIRMVELANEIFPKGVLNIVTGDADVGDAISSHPDVNKIIFTGSTPTGKAIMANSVNGLKRLTLELGGNDAGIVLPDVNVNDVVPKLFGAIFHNNGHTCACLKRLYVHESQYQAISNGLAEMAMSVTLGNGLEDSTELGPIQNAKQLVIVEALINDAKQQGGKILCGGERLSKTGYFFKPTIITGLTDGHRLVDEEQFGPVIAVVKYTDVDEVIERANKNSCGLGGSIWSDDMATAAKLVMRLECGTAWVNEHGGLQPDAPFGGIKQSGIGVEFGQHGLAEYTSLQTVRIPKK